ncbi:MAG: hypothetical protein HQM11_15960 [SAR324 cluster bacterium]|nr:hypothetical protein [SAR324 cluster bacterium]
MTRYIRNKKDEEVIIISQKNEPNENSTGIHQTHDSAEDAEDLSFSEDDSLQVKGTPADKSGHELESDHDFESGSWDADHETPAEDTQADTETTYFEEAEDLETESVSPLTENLEQVEADLSEADDRPFMAKAHDYFRELEDYFMTQISDESEGMADAGMPDITTEEGLVFGLYSVKEAVILCEFLQEYLDQLPKDQLHEIQKIFSFFNDPEEMLTKLKLLFTGDIKVKEKIVRIYASKALSTYRVTRSILENTELFTSLAPADAQKNRENLVAQAEESLKKIKNLLPRSIQSSMTWSRKTLYGNTVQLMSLESPLFGENLNLALLSERYRELIYWLLGNPHILLYLRWKHRYLAWWLTDTLYEQDCRNITKGVSTTPQYAIFKVDAYQQARELFKKLNASDQQFPAQLEMKSTHYSLLKSPQNYKSVKEPLLQQARTAEKEWLEGLTFNQLTTLAAAVHKSITSARKARQIQDNQLPPATGLRTADLESDNQTEKDNMARTVQVHMDDVKEKGSRLSGFMNTLTRLVQKFKIFPDEPESALKPQKNELDEMEHLAKTLDPVSADWYGYGREFKSTIYEPKIPNLQKNFFDQASLKLYLYDDYINCVKAALDYYSDLGYARLVTHKITVKMSGRESMKELDEIGIYLKTGKDQFLVLGKAPFDKYAQPVPYFQLYRTNPIKIYTGTSQNVDFSRTVNKTRYELENIEIASQLRPLVFQAMIDVIESFPPELYKKFKKFQDRLRDFVSQYEKVEKEKTV